MSTDKDDIVLDPFSGTGTTAIAAKRLNRNYIGFELDKNYVAISTKKLDTTSPISKLGNSWVSFYLNNVITIRDTDWEQLKSHYVIPKVARDIESKRIILKDDDVRIGYSMKQMLTLSRLEKSLFD